jgi:L-ribulose-5-phosphate 3-epimerase UlaE
MTAETRRIVLRALDEAMAMAIMNLFEVVNSDTSDESIERFSKGLRKTVDLHDQLVKTLAEEIYDGV